MAGGGVVMCRSSYKEEWTLRKQISVRAGMGMASTRHWTLHCIPRENTEAKNYCDQECVTGHITAR